MKLLSSAKEIRIVGGGLAGLSLGIALQKRGVSTKVIEAGSYPRHKVCGEFISGVSSSTLEALEIAPLFSDAIRHRKVQWRLGERVFREDRLPQDALGISRYALDNRLAREFENAGGRLETNQRAGREENGEGTIWAAGRVAEPSKWIGLKAHFEDLSLDSDLELRLGRGAYVGASKIEDGKVNVCGLFRKRIGIETSRTTALSSYVRIAGLEGFADRLESSSMNPQSASGVAALAFAKIVDASNRIQIGDAFGVMPPFTGNGMSLAFESAYVAAPFIEEYAKEKRDWQETVKAVQTSLAKTFAAKLGASRFLHPWIHSQWGQNAFYLLSKARLVPFKMLLSKVR